MIFKIRFLTDTGRTTMHKVYFRRLCVLVLALMLLPSLASAQEEQIELLWWDSYTEATGNLGAVTEELIAMYEAEHPNVDIVREVYAFQDMQTVMNTAMGSGTGPDIALYGSGAGFMGPLVDAGLLLPLDDYAEQYGWQDRLYPWVWDSTTFDGHIYAVGHELELIGFYYNQRIFEELGVTVPTTYEELVAVSEAAKAAGYIPIAYTNGGGWPAYHLFSSFANAAAGKETMDAVFANEARWTDEPFVQAIQMAFVDMNQAGYYIPSPNAVEYGDGNTLFYTEQSPMLHTGMWLYEPIMENAEFEVGFFPMPSINGNPPLPPGGLGSAVMISADTEHPDEAAAFLDLFFSDEAARMWFEEAKTIPPNDVDPADFELEPLFRGFADTIRAASTEGSAGLGYNIDVLTPPQFNTVMNEGFQAVLNGDRTPEEQAQALQAAWDDYYNQ
jgi:raffinose/stachyose/melibiose transport system substrate-binding protein